MLDVGAFGVGIQGWLKQTESLFTQDYRNLVWEVFNRIVNNTPQWSGLAVANWNLSIGAPDLRMHVAEVDEVLPYGPQHAKGDSEWINVALDRALPVAESIRYRDKVFISNGTVGDSLVWGDTTRSGTMSGFPYLQAMQVPGPWQDSLRAANRPFESVAESVFIVTAGLQMATGAKTRVGGGIRLDQ